jgi:hypothetical protein
MSPPPAPAGPAEGSYAQRRCEFCGGMLHGTLSTGEPQRNDHRAGCQFFAVASQAVQYVVHLRQAAAHPSISSRASRRYLQKSATELARAACAANPVNELTKLAGSYRTEYQKGGGQASYAELLSQACQVLAQGKAPGPSPLVPENTK